MGRIGRAFLRLWAGSEANHPWHKLQLAFISELAPPASLLYGLSHDTRLGPFPVPLRLDTDAQQLYVVPKGGEEICVGILGDLATEPDGGRKYRPDLLVDCTGNNNSSRLAQCCEGAGTKVGGLLANPGAPSAQGAYPPLRVLGMRQPKPSSSAMLLSAASCTSCCLAPVLRALNTDSNTKDGEVSGAVLAAESLTLHAGMADQPLLDTLSLKDDPFAQALARSGVGNAVPIRTALAQGLERLLPELQGRLGSTSLRVPAMTTSAIHLSVSLRGDLSPEILRAKLEAYASENPAELGVRTGPITSSDIQGDTHSAVVDLSSISAHPLASPDSEEAPATLAQMLLWFDNETGYAARLLDIACEMLA